MRVVLQRVSRASVRVDGDVVGAIERGVVLLVGIARGDAGDVLDSVARKIVSLRIFEDEAGKMNRSLDEVHGAILAVPQFTLLGETRKGRRPSFTRAALPQEAAPLFDRFVESLRGLQVPVETGVFGAKMAVELVNDGPVTFIVETESEQDGPS